MDGELNQMVKLILSIVLAGFVGLIFHLYNGVFFKPKKLRLKLQDQGIRGPCPSFFYGNVHEMRRIKLQALSAANSSTPKDHKAAISHDWFPTLFPHLEKWRNEYGSVFLYSTGNLQVLYATDMEMVKEIGLHMSLSLGKPSYLAKDMGPLLGQGILSSSGPIWAHQRKIIGPELFPDRVKGMVNLMVDATTSLLKSWESKVEREGGISEIIVDEDLRNLSADLISRACFGSNYSKGEEIFSKLDALQTAMSKATVGIPGMRYLPSKDNREIWKLEKEIDSMILKVIKQHNEEALHEKNLLQMILNGASICDDYKKLSKERFVVDNCKNMYFAGYETTATTASWTLMLLAAHPDWQARVRAEVLETCKGRLPDAGALRKMKALTMVIQESLRLYPPATFAARQALEDINFKGIMIPKDMNIQIPIPILQQSPELWGPDAHEFNPERFANGIVEACKVPQADMLRSVKVLTMVILENLRLYPPAVFVRREVLQNTEFKGFMIPKGTNIQIPVAVLHQITDLWGPDAHQFNHEIFSTGVFRACKHPLAYLPFRVGTRTCVGQHFAMTELKVVLSVILSKVSVSLTRHIITLLCVKWIWSLNMEFASM